MENSTDIIVTKCRDIAKDGLSPFVEENMWNAYGQGWEFKSNCQWVNGKPHWDLQGLLKTIIFKWNDVFAESKIGSYRSLVFELKDWRNHVAHEHKMNLKDTSRYLDTASRLLKVIEVPQADELNRLNLAVMRAIVEESDVISIVTENTIKPKKPDSSICMMNSTGSKSGRPQNHDIEAPNWSDCISRIEEHLDITMSRKSGRCKFSADDKFGVCCIVSKKYEGERYWWNLRERQLRIISSADHAFVSFACGTPEYIVSIPIGFLRELLPTFNLKHGADGDGWHIHILYENGKWLMLQIGRGNHVDVSKYLI